MYEYDLLMEPKQLGRRVRRLRLRLQSKNQGDFFFLGGWVVNLVSAWLFIIRNML